jgi:hypothetical protein
MAAAILYLLKIEIQIWFEPKKKIKDSRNKIINCVSIVFFIIISSHYSSKLVKVNFHIFIMVHLIYNYFDFIF